MNAGNTTSLHAEENTELLMNTVHDILSSMGEEEKHAWDMELGSATDHMWLRFFHRTARLREQGWKLHISADASSAEQILRRTLPILLHTSVNFKVLSSLKHLAFLNQGGGGISQVGKFITIYPCSDAQAVELALLLATATYTLSGPHIPSDHPLSLDGRVYYRFGGFKSSATIQDMDGRTLPAIRGQEDQLVHDERLLTYQAPRGIADPFIEAGIAKDALVYPRLIGKRYCIVQAIAASVSYTLFIGADLERGCTCVIKGPGRAWHRNPFATHIRTTLRHEAELLAQVGTHQAIPSLYDLLEHEGDLYLVMQDMEGETLEKYMMRQRKQEPLPIDQVLRWARQLLDICMFLHEQGFVHADLKSSNVIVSPREDLSLIDFGIARKIRTDLGWGLGTRGYASPQLQRHQLATVQDDIYSFGAILYYLFTGAEPSLAPDPEALLQRPLEMMRADIPSDLISIVKRCLEREPEDRYSSMREVRQALDTIDRSSLACSECSHWTNADTEKVRAHYRHQANQLFKTLCANAESPADEDEFYWRSAHPYASNTVRRDIYAGSAGVVLVLAEIANDSVLDDCVQARQTLARAARWLVTKFSPEQHLSLTGLYTGEAGVGAALLRAGHVLQDEYLIEQACMHGQHISALPHTTPDMMNGSAGRLRFHLLLWHETQGSEHLRAALACGEHLLELHSKREGEGVAWTIPAGFGNLSGETFLGYAYGAAGIADALLDLYMVTDDQRFLPLIEGACCWLQQKAVPVLTDKSGLNWPISEKKSGLTSPSWMYGAAGIGRFFLHAAQANIFPEAWDIAGKAAKAIIETARWTDPNQSQGLTGNIEFLLDMYQATHEHIYLQEAHTFAAILTAFAQQQHGHLVFSSDFPIVFTPDYMLGYGGVALCFLRLSRAEQMPHQLSCNGFRSHRQSGGKKRGILSVTA